MAQLTPRNVFCFPFCLICGCFPFYPWTHLGHDSLHQCEEWNEISIYCEVGIEAMVESGTRKGQFWDKSSHWCSIFPWPSLFSFMPAPLPTANTTSLYLRTCFGCQGPLSPCFSQAKIARALRPFEMQRRKSVKNELSISELQCNSGGL